MSEQEIDLDTAIQRFQLIETYNEYAEGVREMTTRVHSQEELDRVQKIIDEKKQDLRESNPEFNAIMKGREQEAKRKAELSKALSKAKMAETKAKASMATQSVRGAVPHVDVDDWVARTKMKVVSPEELERKSEEELWCPICRQRDTSNNIVNDEPTCFPCMHRLVPKAELKDYNRDYRRRWKKSRAHGGKARRRVF